jgi:uncharacterized protein (TIGR03083 family)
MTSPALEPVYTSELLVPVHRELVALLRGLRPEQWLLPTTAGTWRVRDVAAHVLDGQLRRLSFHRDALPRPGGGSDDDTYSDLVEFLNELNARWIRAAERLSPAVMTDLLETVGVQAPQFLAGLPPHAPAFWPVAWAGEAQSECWMDVGRDYTEYWHHQQQIRDAVGAPGLFAPRWLAPVIALGVRALPRALAAAARPAGTVVHITVDGEAGGRWSLVREGAGWSLHGGEAAGEVGVRVTFAPEAAARLWYSGRGSVPSPTAAAVEGDPALGQAVLTARAVMV